MTRDQLIGTWRLISFERRSADGGVEYPLGPDATGYFIFGADGYCAVAIMDAHRPKYTTADGLKGTMAERSAAAGYISYAGPYELEPTRVVMTPDVSFFPNWVGVPVIRETAFDGKRLVLSTPPVASSEGVFTAIVTWERA